MAKALNVSEAWLMGHDVSMKRLPLNEGNSECAAAAENDLFPHDLPHLQRIPILGQIRAGLPLYADEHIEGYTYTELNGGAEYFGLRVTGDSMNAAHINLGDILIVRRQNTVENGEIAVVLVDNEAATVKRFYQEGHTVTLVPQSNNPDHRPQLYDIRKTPIRILGKVVRNQIDF